MSLRSLCSIAVLGACLLGGLFGQSTQKIQLETVERLDLGTLRADVVIYRGRPAVRIAKRMIPIMAKVRPSCGCRRTASGLHEPRISHKYLIIFSLGLVREGMSWCGKVSKWLPPGSHALSFYSTYSVICRSYPFTYPCESSTSLGPFRTASAWSPNAKQISFTTDLGGCPNLWKVSASGGWLVQLT